ncbi:hypothetical protein, partial [Parasphingorhabdus sp.]|uniref:hypothetical protein n=1 Tax=Parasphingorhabdus sp. TaxID=2709688 RepID=UPI0032EFCCB6
SAKQAENAPKTANISPEWRATGAIVRKRHSFRHIPPNRLVVAGVQLRLGSKLPSLHNLLIERGNIRKYQSIWLDEAVLIARRDKIKIKNEK